MPNAKHQIPNTEQRVSSGLQWPLCAGSSECGALQCEGGAPLPWQGLKIARHLPPVCPQKLPDLSLRGSENMSRGRHKHLSRLLPYLRTESEDCLYLNLYVPHDEPQSTPKQYAVLVYLHGESFEWNSGNPYDGSVLSSYGEVIVVTVNYRLGALGFLRPSIDAHNIANYALLDQIAALHWIKENIGAFGGDNSRVTLMGHSTGAACVNYLMVSPVASGLFHRAILMSGSAMSDWAASNQSLQLTMQIAHALDCPLNEHVGAEDDDVLLDCLRHRRYQDILHIPTALTQFSTSLGPIVDGHVIPNQPYKVMGHYTEHFSRYDLLFGITESESYHTLAALALEEGLRENERDNLLRFYMQSRFDVRPDLALAATLKKYQDMYNNPIKATNLEHRDVVLDILSDARVVGPLLQTGMFHADVNRRNYMYVFGHNSASGPYAHLPHSIMGEELAFIFGAPLATAGPFPSGNYTVQEKLLSEAVMAYWTNFVKTGNPKAPWKGVFLNSHALEWDRYDLDWPEFNRRAQAYLNIGIPPTVGYKYRQLYMNFWNKELPDELNQIAAIQEQLHGPGQEVIAGHMSKYGPREHGAEDPVRTLKLLLQEPSLAGPPRSGESTEAAAENMYNAPPTFGHVHKVPGGSESESESDAATSASIPQEAGEERQQVPPETVARSEATMQLLIALIAIIIVLNLLIYGTFLLRQRRRRAKALPFPAPKLGGTILSYDGANDEELKRCSKSRDGDDSFALELSRKSNTYEAIKTGQRSLSCSTVDTHTKVCEWMSGQEALAPKSGSFTPATPPPPPVHSDGRLIICRDIEVADAALLIPQHMHEPQHYEMLLQRQHSALTEPSEDTLEQQQEQQYPYPLRDRPHCHSDPVDMILAADEQVTSFVHADDVDINVTSRQDSDGMEVVPLTAAQQLELLRLRNYPKVLPTEQDLVDSSCKRNSLPPQSLSAPLPPPRTISHTLGRRRRDSSNVTTSPLQLARDEDEPLKEPQISQNTLIVGPIVPKSPASSLKRAKRVPASLGGSFQSFESVPPAHETTPPQGTERTECIYAIKASPALASWSAPNGDLYAQPLKSPSRTSLIPRPTKQADSLPPGDPPGDPLGGPLGEPLAAPAPASRIPQLQRQASGRDLPTTMATEGIENPPGCQQRTDSTISSGSSASNASSFSSSSSSSTGTVRTELQQFQPPPGRSITTNI
ncbi:neuroligin-4, X-linked isoform X1 [Drosophila elegans]|uniref:neuroligin-4, X-linked isoform X1 n=1 Tax=Drosophila elegans TaxID=30023 RepID=UPI001BC83C1F|nr:neuroligin-4, X-linked isoform X1 [Drosophila elegans]